MAFVEILCSAAQDPPSAEPDCLQALERRVLEEDDEALETDKQAQPSVAGRGTPPHSAVQKALASAPLQAGSQAVVAMAEVLGAAKEKEVGLRSSSHQPHDGQAGAFCVAGLCSWEMGQAHEV